MTAGLRRLVVEGFGSIRHVELELTTDVTVLIGANGSGKSNLVNALELVSRIWDDSFQEYLLRRGGLDDLLFEDYEGRTDHVLIELMSEFDEKDACNGYRVILRPGIGAEDDWAELHEYLLFQAGRDRDRPYDEDLGASTRSRILQISRNSTNLRLRNFAAYVRPILEGCRVFHFDDVSDNAPVKGPSTVGDDLALRSDAENIAAYLLRVQEEHPERYRRIVAAIRRVAPFFDDFVLVPNRPSERIRLRWKQRGLDRTFMAREASDGTLRFICLATLLLGPDLPATVVLDEPELGLHPAAIGLLAEMTRVAGRNGHKIIIATQSVPLLSHYALEEVAVLDRTDGATDANRPDAEGLAGFLEEYSIGTLWEMNLLGGRPVHSEVKP
ncbi:AAA family ATPase [uncultured Propionibacterium sp.]|uniref:AAA family ATPase n=1 Tax=uncultured Propionibacterium sp. TaxID=218066 RepID=UPI00292F9A99|nr:AAA family ATPase [uncultured Propionibacterium sp.]